MSRKSEDFRERQKIMAEKEPGITEEIYKNFLCPKNREIFAEEKRNESDNGKYSPEIRGS